MERGQHHQHPRLLQAVLRLSERQNRDVSCTVTGSVDRVETGNVKCSASEELNLRLQSVHIT